MIHALPWVAVVLAFVFAFAWLNHLDACARGVSASLANLSGINFSKADALAARVKELEAKLDLITQRIGYEENVRWLSDATIWKEEERRKDLGSLFPRVSWLEMELSSLKDKTDVRFDINGLKDWNDLTPEERRSFWITDSRRA